MAQQHTPGPWRAGSEDGDPTMSAAVFKVGGSMVCSTTGYFAYPARLANACLIAAAPDRLKALAELVARCEHDGIPNDSQPAVEAACAAIAKAQGSQQ